MNEIPLIDWNGNGKIDPSDMALSFAIAESEGGANDTDDESAYDREAPYRMINPGI